MNDRKTLFQPNLTKPGIYPCCFALHKFIQLNWTQFCQKEIRGGHNNQQAQQSPIGIHKTALNPKSLFRPSPVLHVHEHNNLKKTQRPSGAYREHWVQLLLAGFKSFYYPLSIKYKGYSKRLRRYLKCQFKSQLRATVKQQLIYKFITASLQSMFAHCICISFVKLIV
jgi:hypothetical protein